MTMKSARRERIALELLGPPLAGGIIIGLAFIFPDLVGKSKLRAWWEHIPLGLYSMMIAVTAAYIMACIPSILYTCVMEWRFSRGLDPRSWQSIGLSTLLGLASGSAIALTYGYERADPLLFWLKFCGTGLAVGFLMGLWIKSLATTKHPICLSPIS